MMPTYRGTNLDAVRSMGGIFGSCAFISDVGARVAAGRAETLFVDPLGAAPPLVFFPPLQLTAADANFFNGRGEAGEVVTCFDFKVGMVELDPNFARVFQPPGVVSDWLNKISLTMNLRGSEYPLGCAALYPTQQGIGPGFFNNGGFGVPPFRFPRETLLQIGPMDEFSVVATAERTCFTSAPGNRIFLQTTLAASTAVSLSNLSGA